MLLDRLDSMSDITQQEIDDIVWADIDASFSVPVSPEDEKTSYIPTHIIAELFRSNGFDGIAYRSATSDAGYNVALFDVADAKIAFCQLFKISSIEYKATEYSSPYFVKDGSLITPVVTEVRQADGANISD